MTNSTRCKFPGCEKSTRAVQAYCTRCKALVISGEHLEESEQSE